jgi:hypothetical protein
MIGLLHIVSMWQIFRFIQDKPNKKVFRHPPVRHLVQHMMSGTSYHTLCKQSTFREVADLWNNRTGHDTICTVSYLHGLRCRWRRIFSPSSSGSLYMIHPGSLFLTVKIK